jgi:membrane protein
VTIHALHSSKGYAVTIGGIEVWPTVKATAKRFTESDLQGMAAEMVYHLLFSLVPLLIFLTSLSGFVGRRIGTGNVIDEITGWLRTGANLPPSTVEVVLEPIEQVLDNQTGGLLSIGAVIALWSGKNAISALMKGLNVAYGVEETRPWWKTWAIALGLTIALGLAAITASFFFVTSTAAGARIAGWLNLSSAWETVWTWLRLPLIALIICLVVSFFYWIGPDRPARYQLITAGSVLTVVLWTLATLGLGLYFQYMGGYVATYGVLGGVLGFLFWLYLMSLILLFGGQLNAIFAAQRATGASAEEAAETTRVDRGAARAPREDAPSPPAPVPVTSSIRDEIRGWERRLPSAEAAARQAMASPSVADRLLQQVRVVRLLGAAAVAALSVLTAVIGSRRRS